MPDLISIGAAPAQSVTIASRAGFAGLDMRINRHAAEIERLNPNTLAAAMQAASLRPGYCSITPQKISVPDEMWAEELADAPHRAMLARDLGYTRATSVVLPFHDELSWRVNFEMHRDRARQACDVLGEHGISFGLEYVSPMTRRRGKKHEFVHNLAQLMELVEAVDRPNIGVMLDCFHWACAQETPEDIEALPAERVVAVHVNDLAAGVPLDEQDIMSRGLPGESGVVDMPGFIGALARIGYTGPVTAEPTNPRWAETPAEESARLTARAVRSCLETAGVDVRAGNTTHSGTQQ
ncbi:MAG: sugar phosphate isomerase/epimerase family protein [Planctomycetota bacterium]